MSEKEPNLGAAYALETPEDSVKLYAEWAATYDTRFAERTGYMLHVAVADAFLDAGGRGPVLDLGAGTGLCGARLKQRGAGPIHATDISDEMLDVARSKSIFDHLFQGNVLETLPVPAGVYQGVVSSGTFTLGHVGPEGLDEVVRVLAPGGLAVLSIRDTHFETAGFALKLQSLSSQIDTVSSVPTTIYAGTSDPGHADDKAFIVTLRRT